MTSNQYPSLQQQYDDLLCQQDVSWIKWKWLARDAIAEVERLSTAAKTGCCKGGYKVAATNVCTMFPHCLCSAEARAAEAAEDARNAERAAETTAEFIGGKAGTDGEWARCRSGLGYQGEFLTETQCTLTEGHAGPHQYASDPRSAVKTSRDLSASEAASFDKTLARSPRRIPCVVCAGKPPSDVPCTGCGRQS